MVMEFCVGGEIWTKLKEVWENTQLISLDKCWIIPQCYLSISATSVMVSFVGNGIHCYFYILRSTLKFHSNNEMKLQLFRAVGTQIHTNISTRKSWNIIHLFESKRAEEDVFGELVEPFLFLWFVEAVLMNPLPCSAPPVWWRPTPTCIRRTSCTETWNLKTWCWTLRGMSNWWVLICICVHFCTL